MRRLLLAVTVSMLAATCPLRAVPADAGPDVHVVPPKLDGPRVLNDQTKEAVIRGYLEAWQSLRGALRQNRTDLLDRNFVGTAKDKLVDTIHDQVTTGISARYLDRSHNLQIVFYSPEGLSVQLVDDVTYDVQLVDHGETQATQPEHARYIVVMTPAEVRWRVRVLQGTPE